MDEYIRKSDAIEQALSQIHSLDITVRERILNFDGKGRDMTPLENHSDGYEKLMERASRAGFNPERKTNADRIRAMTDEELAHWILSVQQDIVSYYACEKHVPELPVERHTWLDWLRQEVSTDG